MSNELKLYLDEDTINRKLIKALRARNIDVLTAQEANQMGIPDIEQLAFATSKQRAISTFNVGDFVQLHTLYLAQGHSHGGIIVSDQLPVVNYQLASFCAACLS
ncbi:MAG: DUF5615 family PIN-like protein [Chloroflexota bacterium]